MSGKSKLAGKCVKIGSDREFSQKITRSEMIFRLENGAYFFMARRESSIGKNMVAEHFTTVLCEHNTVH